MLRCTTRLLDVLGNPAEALIDAPTAKEDWYANLIWIDRKKCMLLMHQATLLPIFAANLHVADLRPLHLLAQRLIYQALDDEQLPRDTLGRLDATAPALARTASRQMLGFMTQAAAECRYHVELQSGLRRTNISALNHWLRRMLRHRDGYHQPLELAAARATVQ